MEASPAFPAMPPEKAFVAGLAPGPAKETRDGPKREKKPDPPDHKQSMKPKEPNRSEYTSRGQGGQIDRKILANMG